MKKEVKETLMNSLLDDIDNLPIEDGSVLQPETTIEIIPFNLDEKQQKCGMRAKRLITSMLKLLSDADVLEKSDYLKAKKRIDIMSLYQIFLSIEQLEHVIQRLVDEVDAGNTNSRIFEVFGNLQRTKLDMIKEGALFIMQMEDNVKRLTLEQKSKMNVVNAEPNKLGSQPYRGQRALMQQVKGELTPIEPIKEKEVENGKKE